MLFLLAFFLRVAGLQSGSCAANIRLQNATALSTISDDMKSTIVTRYSIPADKVQVIYNWGHEELKAHSDEENVFLKKYPKKSGEFRVVYAGNLGKIGTWSSFWRPLL